MGFKNALLMREAPAWLLNVLGMNDDPQDSSASAPVMPLPARNTEALAELVPFAVGFVIAQRDCLGDEHRSHLIAQLTAAVVSGEGVAQLSAALKRQRIGDDPLEIARDLIFHTFALCQIGALHEAGYEYFQWLCANDDCGHMRLNGKIFKLDDEVESLPGVGKGCGCVASGYSMRS